MEKIGLSKESLEYLLNYTLNVIEKDKEQALEDHNTIITMLDDPVIIGDVAKATAEFLKHTVASTDQMIKIANIVANHVSKIKDTSKDEGFTREEWESIHQVVESIKNQNEESKGQLKLVQGGK